MPGGAGLTNTVSTPVLFKFLGENLERQSSDCLQRRVMYGLAHIDCGGREPRAL